MKTNLGILIGRLNPPHLGHIRVINKALEDNNKVLILLGSSNIINENNPFSYEERKYFLENYYKNEIENGKIIISFIEDTISDEEWTKNIGEKIKNIPTQNDNKITFYGGDFANDSAIIVIKENIKFLGFESINFFEVYRNDFILPSGDTVSSTKVRDMLVNKDFIKLEDYLPEKILNLIIEIWNKKIK